ncbi:MAG TPA: HEAT repeat domain-containing protein [Candidatus Acidoferrum sp.]|nr:HEAT repeat domain-containing protein [Candidatus Acidoferrum sp.]
MRNRAWIVVAFLLAMPSFAPHAAAAFSASIAAPQSASAAESQASDATDRDEEANDFEQGRQDQEQEKRDREQEARDREQEKRDREEEKRDREQERLERLTELYDEGREALDEDRYERAESKFDQLAQMHGPQTDAALYWKAYAENRLGKRDTALANIAEIKRRFPQSRWQKDANALELEVRQSAGQPVHPEAQKDDELRMLALRGIMNSDPDRAVPLLGKVLESGSGSPKEKSQALFVLAQSGSPQAREILGKIARGQSNPDLQRKAIQYLAMFGGAESRKTLAEVYATTSDPSIKRAILRAYMIGGDREHLFEAAKNEKDDEVKREAIRQLGLVHAQNELQQLYRSDNSPAVRRELLQAFFLAGDAPKLLEAAQSEKDPELRRVAVRNLGLIHSEDSAKALQGIYSKETDRGIREEVLNSFFLQGNAAAIVAIARGEKDPELKRTAVSKLSIMHSKEATDYLMEILQKN